MKKIQLEALEKISEERKLDKETKEKIIKKALKNFLFATIILLFFISLKLMAINLEKQLAILIFKILSIVVFILTLILFELAYKKDSDNLAITGIEMFFVSIITLLMPYIFINRVNVYTSSVGVFFVLYYAIKNIIIYRNEKRSYIKKKNDINQIIKKESKDELAQEQLEKAKIEKTKVVEHKKRGRPRKTTNNVVNKKNTAVKTTVKTTQNETEPPKRKRGRPRKIID